jgi:hypothetical protein
MVPLDDDAIGFKDRAGILPRYRVRAASHRASIESFPSKSSSLPSPLDGHVRTTVRPTRSERKLLMDGGPMTKLLDADGGKEVAVFGAVWIDAHVRAYLQAVKDVSVSRTVAVRRRVAFTNLRARMRSF